MRRSMSGCTLALLLLPIAVRAQGALSTEQQMVLRTDSMRLQAVLRADTLMLRRMLTPDWLLISGVTGERLTRGAYLKGLATGARRLGATTHDSLQVRIHGTTAILTGRSTSSVVRNGSGSSAVVWFTHIYVREGNDWRMVSMHVSADAPRRRPVADTGSGGHP